jgi:predicted PurR-regulated permease PerM
VEFIIENFAKLQPACGGIVVFFQRSLFFEVILKSGLEFAAFSADSFQNLCDTKSMKDRFRTFNSGRANFFLVAIITFFLAGAVLKITSSVLLPFTISLLLALVTTPLVNFLGKFGIPRISSVFLALIFLIGGLCFIGMVLFSSGRALLTLYPKYEDRLTEIYIWVSRFFELPYDEHLSFFENLWGQLGVRSRVRMITISLSNTFLVFLKDAFMVALFMVFLLLEAVFFKEKLDKAFEGPRSGQIKKISADVMKQVARYLSIKFILSLVTGLVVGVGLKIVGVEFAVVWGVIQFILNFIPNIGSIAVGLAATLFSLVQFWPHPAPIIATGIIMLGTNMVIGSILEPKIMGDNLGLSPLVVLVALLAWGWLWGFAGLILAVPMMVIIKIVCENIPMLEPISILLGSRKAVMASRTADDDGEEIVSSGL